MSMLKDIADKEFNKLLNKCNWANLTYSVVDLRIDEQHNLSEVLLKVVLAPASDTLSTLGMALCDGKSYA